MFVCRGIETVYKGMIDVSGKPYTDYWALSHALKHHFIWGNVRSISTEHVMLVSISLSLSIWILSSLVKSLPCLYSYFPLLSNIEWLSRCLLRPGNEIRIQGIQEALLLLRHTGILEKEKALLPSVRSAKGKRNGQCSSHLK